MMLMKLGSHLENTKLDPHLTECTQKGLVIKM